MPSSAFGECFVCSDPITAANDSREHVIPNAIGGRLKTKGFACEPCNNTSGHKWDNALAQQLQALCLFFHVARERGETRPFAVETTAGEQLMMLPGGGLGLPRPTWKEVKTGERIQIQIAARNHKEARQMLKGIRRKYPNANVDENVLSTATQHTSYPNGLVKFSISIGGTLGGRSIVKTAAAFAHHVGIPVSACNLATKYIREQSADACFGYYYERDLIASRPMGVPFHCVAISADPTSGRVFGYVEYFAGHRMIVCLSDSYDGPRVSECYAIDPTTGQKLKLAVQIPSFSPAEIADIYEYKKIPEGCMEEAYKAVLSTGLRKQFENEKQRAISDAVEYGFRNCGAREGEIITEEHAKVMAGLIAHRMMPFILRHVPRPQPLDPSSFFSPPNLSDDAR